MTRESVLVVCGAGYVSGKEIMALELARGLVAKGHRVTFVASYWSDHDFQKRLEVENLEYTVLPTGFISATLTWSCIRMTAEQMWRWPELLVGYARLLRRERPARVVHTNWQHLMLLFPLLRPERDLFWLHEIVPESPRYGRLFRRLERRLGCFVCVSEAVSRSLCSLGVKREKVVVIPNGISDPASSWYQRHGEKPARQPGPCRVGIVGQVGRWKGHDDLLDAVALLAGEGLSVELEVFGGGDERYRLDLGDRATRLGLQDAVKWRGFVSSQTEIYRNLDICVVPSRFEEPFGLAALEPAFFEIPVVATNRGGLPGVVADRLTGILVNAERPTELAGALRELVGDAQLRASMGKSARERAVQYFSVDRLAEEFSRLLMKVAA